MSEALERLLAQHDIATLKYRYVRALEERDWEAWADSFTEDAEATFMPAPGETQSEVHRSRAELREWVPTALDGVYPIIRISMPDIEILGPDRARADWAQVERLAFTDGPLRETTYYGYYHETYQRCADGRWRIDSLTMTRLRHDSVDRSGTTTVHLDIRDRLVAGTS